MDSWAALRFLNCLLNFRNSNLNIFDGLGKRTHTWPPRGEGRMRRLADGGIMSETESVEHF